MLITSAIEVKLITFSMIMFFQSFLTGYENIYIYIYIFEIYHSNLVFLFNIFKFHSYSYHSYYNTCQPTIKSMILCINSLLHVNSILRRFFEIYSR